MRYLLLLLFPILLSAATIQQRISEALTSFPVKYDFSVLIPPSTIISHVKINGAPYNIKFDENYRATNYQPYTSNNQIQILSNPNTPKFVNAYVASSFKTIIAAMILRRIEQGVISLDSMVNRIGAIENDISPSLTIREVLHDMIIYSDNECTRYLMSEVLEHYRPSSGYFPGGDKKFVWINALLKNNNLAGLWLYHGWSDNAMTSYDTVKLYNYLWTGKILGYGTSTIISDTSRKYLLSLLKKQYWNDTLSSNFPNDSSDFEPSVYRGIDTDKQDYYHKTGWTNNSVSDSGIVVNKRTGRYYVISLFSSGVSFDHTRKLGQAIDKIIGEVQ